MIINGSKFLLQATGAAAPEPPLKRPATELPLNPRTATEPLLNLRPAIKPPLNTRPATEPLLNLRPAIKPPLNLRTATAPLLKRPATKPPLNLRPATEPPRPMQGVRGAQPPVVRKEATP